MLVKTKFEIDDTVYTIGRGTTKSSENCPVCGGGGQLFRRDGTNTMDCPECKGSGTIDFYSDLRWSVDARVINQINVCKGRDRIGGDYERVLIRTYRSKDMGSRKYSRPYEITADRVFATEHGAEAECSGRNADLDKAKAECLEQYADSDKNTQEQV